MDHSDNFTFWLLWKDSNKIFRRIHSLTLRAGRFFEGRSDGKFIKELSRQWLIQSTEPPSLILQTKCEENWKTHIEGYPEFIINKLLDSLNEFEVNNIDLTELISQSSQLTSILRNSNWFSEVKNRELARNLIANLGCQYFEIAKKIVFAFERENLNCSKDTVPTSLITRYIKLKVLAYFLAYSGALFITYEMPKKKYFEKSWCNVCFRRTKLGSSSCKFHQSGNDYANARRYGNKIRQAFKETEPEKFRVWEDLKMCIKDHEDEELEHKCSFDKPLYDWKKALISFVESKAALGTRLSIEKIEQFNNWVEAVDYLRDQLENSEEKSIHPQAVKSWLGMAAEWFEIEDKFISKDGKKLRKSRSHGSVLPTRQLILNEFKIERNFDIKNIALKLGLTETRIRDCIFSDEELLEIYLGR